MLYAQRDAITAPKQLAIPVVARGVVVDLIAVANGEAGLGAVPPDRTLHEPRKRRRKSRIELAGVDVGCKEMENFSASSRPVASIPVWVVSAQPVENPGSVQEIVDEGVDRHEGRADFDPQRPSMPAANSKFDNPIANTLSETP